MANRTPVASGEFGRAVIYAMSLAMMCAPKLCTGMGLHKSRNFLADHKFEEGFTESMRAVLTGSPTDPILVETSKNLLVPMWNTMPKVNGKVDRRALRYLAYRYYMQTSSLLVRGFEPTRQVNNSHWGVADVLSQMVPAYVESFLESQHASQHGFSLNDVVELTLTLDRMIFESQAPLLDHVFTNQQLNYDDALSLEGLEKVIEEYMLRWMVELEEADYALLLGNRSVAADVLPNYLPLQEFIHGRVRTLKVVRERSPPKGRARDVMMGLFNYNDAHYLVGVIAKTFSSFWEQSECGPIKSHLISMDTHNTGRVPLAKFYDQGVNAEWRFGESTDYLRDLGALDETSTFMGPQVIIANYLKAASNCFVQTAHYLICCPNDCETLLGELESKIQEPAATPITILNTVENMTLQMTLDEEVLPNMDTNLVRQLEQIADKNGGLVPLHGRLFAQWMHYVFPRECAFPHKMGTVSTVTPSEYGDQYEALEADMRKHASNASNSSFSNVTFSKEALQWMSQWSEDEELIVDYTDQGTMRKWLYFIAVAVFMMIAKGTFSTDSHKKNSASIFGTSTIVGTTSNGDKIHFV
jgi:hypothetical protein